MTLCVFIVQIEFKEAGPNLEKQQTNMIYMFKGHALLLISITCESFRMFGCEFHCCTQESKLIRFIYVSVIRFGLSLRHI